MASELPGNHLLRRPEAQYSLEGGHGQGPRLLL